MLRQSLDFLLTVFTINNIGSFFNLDFYNSLFAGFKKILIKFPINCVSLESMDLHWLIVLLIEIIQPIMTLDSIEITARILNSESLIVKNAANSTWGTIFSGFYD